MSKTDTTKKLEKLLATRFRYGNDFYVFECTLGWNGKEIVDCVMYNCQREVHCFEIKQSVSDFHSKCAWSFFGNKNYFVMPLDVYEKVKEEIPEDIGALVAIDHIETVREKTEYGTTSFIKLHTGLKSLHCVKHARSRLLRADKEIILSSMLRCALTERVSNEIKPFGEQTKLQLEENT